jgi:prepilin-type N-terminal cleavage/methylation domain-containing protein
MKTKKRSRQSAVGSGQSAVDAGRKADDGGRKPDRSPLSTHHSPLSSLPSGFTLVELLVTIAIIGLLAGMSLSVYQLARNAGRAAATKATIAKLNNIIMQRYESYMTRRVPLPSLVYPSGLNKGNPLSPTDAAQDRLYAIRDLMRMEMPDRADDIRDNPIVLPNSQQSVPRPALSQLYYNYWSRNKDNPSATGVNNGQAEFLYLIVSMGSPEAMDQFNASEIGDTNGNGWMEFLDGWGRPIFFLRWAPGFSPYSQVQVDDPTNHHDPFDPRHVDAKAYQLFPLIYSGASQSDPGLLIQDEYYFAKDSNTIKMFDNDTFRQIGAPKTGTSYGGITNQTQ